MRDTPVNVRLTQRHDYQFDTQFGPGLPGLQTDLPAPLGQGAGPSPEHLLCAAVGNCLSASLLFSLRKFKQRPEPISCEVSAEVGRAADKRLRVLGISARLTLGVAGEALEQLQRVLDSFEDFCTVTASVRDSIPVSVAVFDAQGKQLK